MKAKGSGEGSPGVACMAPSSKDGDIKGKKCGLCRALGNIFLRRSPQRVVGDKASSRSRDGGGRPRNKGPPVECRLPCSLEDLYRGATKKMKITRDVLGSDGKTRMVEEILPVTIKPGWRKGTRITISGKGHEGRDFVPSDIVFVVDERPHELYTREGDDLVAVEQITLVQALTGYTSRLPTLDGRSIVVSINNVIHPDYEEVLEGEGMPIAGDDKEPHRRKGKLRIRFQIEFPSELTADQKTAIRDITQPSLSHG